MGDPREQQDTTPCGEKHNKTQREDEEVWWYNRTRREPDRRSQKAESGKQLSMTACETASRQFDKGQKALRASLPEVGSLSKGLVPVKLVVTQLSYRVS